MPSYYNPYNFYPATYQTAYPVMNPSQMQTAVPMQQSFAQQPQLKAMEWVEGEVGAKAYQMPQGWPANQPIPLWDSTDMIIWLKSWGPMGIPNPMQKLHYTMPEQQNQTLLANGQQSGATENSAQQQDMSNFATKDDINALREEVRMMRQHNQNQNRSGNYSGQNAAPSNQNGSNSVNMNRGGNQ